MKKFWGVIIILLALFVFTIWGMSHQDELNNLFFHLSVTTPATISLVFVAFTLNSHSGPFRSFPVFVRLMAVLTAISAAATGIIGSYVLYQIIDFLSDNIPLQDIRPWVVMISFFLHSAACTAYIVCLFRKKKEQGHKDILDLID